MKSVFFAFSLIFIQLACFGQDIVITSVTGSKSFEQYAALVATVTIKNEGIVATPSFSIKGVLSTDQVFNDEDYGLYTNYLSLAPGESKTIELKSYTFEDAPVGNYYLIIKADEYSSVTETDESNNTSITSGYSVTPGNVDLTFQSCTLESSTASQFSELDVHYTVVNTGTTSLYKRVTTTFYLSSDNVLSGNDTKLDFWISNPVSNTFSDTWSLEIPGKVPGNYFILAMVDNSTNIGATINETNETNNQVSLPLTITASNIDLDLIMTNSIQFSDGQIVFDMMIENDGTTPVYIDGDDISIHGNGSPLPGYCFFIGETIEPGEIKYFPYVMYNYFSMMSYSYYTLYINESHSIAETNYSNNSLELGQAAPTLYPIVNVSAASLSDSYDQTDTQLLVDVTFYNSGDSYQVYEPVHIKINNGQGQTIYTYYNYFIDSYFENGSSKTRQFEMNLNNTLPPGNYTLSVTADNSFSTTITIHPAEFSLSGTIQDDSGTPITKGKLFLYQKKDDGSIKFINQLQKTTSNDFSFQVDERDYTLYFIPDRIAFPDHLPTVFGKTLMLGATSFVSLMDDTTVVMEVLKITPPAAGPGIISGTIMSGSSSGKVRASAAQAASIVVILLNSDGNPAGITNTDETGYFIFENLLPDQYSIAVTSDLDQPISQDPYPVDISTANVRIELTISQEGISGESERVLYEQSIAFSEIGSKTFGDESFELEATTDSGLPVTYTSSDTDIATIDGTSVIILRAGTVTITAHQEGNESYEATESAQAITIHKAAQTIDFETITNKGTDEVSFELNASVDSELGITFESNNTDIISIVGTTAFIVGPGEITITAKQAGDENYEEAEPVAHTFTVNLVLGRESDAVAAKVFPNPTSDVIRINADLVISGVSLTHSSGRKEKVELKGNEISIKHVAAGVYILGFNEGGIQHLLKVVKK